ncbi:TonB-dependent receptor [Sphingobium sp. B2]|uniref:TonB-dependent receptor n=1 Tax=Sphingobium sp. B2 TaxID=2583228 RepID=UPI00119DC638|nr:TonB-dependent receptor [Sphingobium sp. B2]
MFSRVTAPVGLAALLCGVSPLVLAAEPALAQVAPEAAEAEQSAFNDSNEIIVTANRRAQSTSSVGMTIQSLNGDVLAARGVSNASDLAKIVTGFTAADTGFNTPVYSLRGVGFNDPSLASNSTVAVAVDEIPLPYSVMTQGATLDLQRLEVLKGPQGTLYGLNATGGAINYIANKPTDDFRAGGQVTFGRFATAIAEGYVSGPISDTLKARIAVTGTLGGDWQRSYTRNDELGQTKKFAARLQLAWTPTERLKVELIGNGWLDRSDTVAQQLVGFRAQVPSNAVRLPQVFSYPLAPRDARAADWTPGDYGRDDSFYQLGAKIGYELTDNIQLSSISAYSDYETHASTDRDGMVPRNFNVRSNGSITSLYQEVRLIGTMSALTWSLGGNYRRDKIYDQQLTSLPEGTNSFSAGFHFDTPDVFSRQKVETFAIFGDGEFSLNDQFSVIGGIRYTKDKRDFAGCTADNGVGDTSALYTFLTNLFRGRAGLPQVAPPAPGQCVTLSRDTFIPGIVNDSQTEDNVAFRTGINFKPSPGSLLYATYSRGYKAGSFPTLGAAFAIGYGPAKQERLDAIEVGFKTALLDRRLRINGAAFHYDYFDKQLRGRIVDPVAGSLSKLVNIPKSEIWGIEGDMTLTPMDGLNLYAAASYLHTEVKEFVGINLFSQSEDFKGQTLNFAPPWSVNAGGEYKWALSGALNGVLGADYGYRSRTSGFLGRDLPMDIKAYSTLDLRAGVESDKGWSLIVWGNNVTNTYYWTTTNRGTDTFTRIAAKPVTYGVTFKVGY